MTKNKKEETLNLRLSKEESAVIKELSVRLGLNQSQLLLLGLGKCCHDYIKTAQYLHLEIPNILFRYSSKYYNWCGVKDENDKAI